MADFKSGQDPFAEAPADIPAGQDPFATQAQQSLTPQPQPANLEQLLGPSEFTKAFASTPARMLKSAMQMVGAGDYVPEAVSNAAAQGNASLPGRIVGDVAGTGGIRAGAGALAGALQRLNAARGVVPAVARTAEAAAYGGAQGAITSPDDQANAAAWGAAGGAVMPVAGSVLRLAGRGAAHVLGGTTGAGAESVRQAFRNAPGFVENMRGAVPAADVVGQARQGIQTMRQTMRDNYRAAVPQWASGHTMEFAPVGRAFAQLESTLQHGGQWKIGAAEQRTIGELRDVLTDFAANRSNHTAEGFDALKQRIQAIYPEQGHRQAQRAVATMADAVRNQIIEQSPPYAHAMRDYWQRSSQLDEIERSLSLGDRQTVDTALRKLQSLMRNNASTNYGQRLASAEALAQQGGADVMPALAGQAMNDWLPRGIARGVGAATLPPALFSGGLGIPAAIGSAVVQSPRIVGETARATGQIVRDPRTQATLDALRRLTPATVREVTRDDR